MTDYSTMGVPFRLEIQKRICSVVERVNKTNGYPVDLPCLRGRLVFDDNDPLPMCSILEPPIPEKINFAQQDGDRGVVPNTYELLLQGFVDDDRQNPTDPAHYLMAMVKKELTAERLKTSGRQRDILGFGGRVDSLFIGQGAVRPGDLPSMRAFFWVTLSLKIFEDTENPYTYI